jgi:hypothetical protein
MNSRLVFAEAGTRKFESIHARSSINSNAIQPFSKDFKRARINIILKFESFTGRLSLKSYLVDLQRNSVDEYKSVTRSNSDGEWALRSRNSM